MDLLQAYSADILSLIFRQLSSIDRMLICGVSKRWKNMLEMVSQQIAKELGSDCNIDILCHHKDYHAWMLCTWTIFKDPTSFFGFCKFGCISLVKLNIELVVKDLPMMTEGLMEACRYNQVSVVLYLFPLIHERLFDGEASIWSTCARIACQYGHIVLALRILSQHNTFYPTDAYRLYTIYNITRDNNQGKLVQGYIREHKAATIIVDRHAREFEQYLSSLQQR